jgi:hypothetical protein
VLNDLLWTKTVHLSKHRAVAVVSCFDERITTLGLNGMTISTTADDAAGLPETSRIDSSSPRGTSPGRHHRLKGNPESREYSIQMHATAHGRDLVVARPARACWLNHPSGALSSESEDPDVR